MRGNQTCRPDTVVIAIALRYVRPGQLNKLCFMHVNQQAELADSHGFSLLVFEACRLLTHVRAAKGFSVCFAAAKAA